MIIFEINPLFQFPITYITFHMYGGGFCYYFIFVIASVKEVMFAIKSHTSKMRKIGDLHLTHYILMEKLLATLVPSSGQRV